MSCPYCGAPLRSAGRFCSSCGRPVPNAVAEPLRLWHARRTTWRRTVAGALLMTAAFVCLSICFLTIVAKSLHAPESRPAAAPQPLADPADLAARTPFLFTSFAPDQPSYFAEDSFAQGAAFAANGAYHIIVERKETRIKSAINLAQADFAIEVGAGLQSAAAGSYFGLMVRARDNSGRDGVSLEINSDGMWRVTAEDPGGETVIVHPWTVPQALPRIRGSTIITATVAGSVVDFYVNGAPALRYDNAPAAGSYIAVLASTTPAGARVHACFHYVLVE